MDRHTANLLIIAIKNAENRTCDMKGVDILSPVDCIKLFSNLLIDEIGNVQEAYSDV